MSIAARTPAQALRASWVSCSRHSVSSLASSLTRFRAPERSVQLVPVVAHRRPSRSISAARVASAAIAAHSSDGAERPDLDLPRSRPRRSLGQSHAEEERGRAGGPRAGRARVAATRAPTANQASAIAAESTRGRQAVGR